MRTEADMSIDATPEEVTRAVMMQVVVKEIRDDKNDR